MSFPDQGKCGDHIFNIIELFPCIVRTVVSSHSGATLSMPPVMLRTEADTKGVLVKPVLPSVNLHVTVSGPPTCVDCSFLRYPKTRYFQIKPWISLNYKQSFSLTCAKHDP